MLYVTMTDKGMSGWGMAKGRVNKLVLECRDMKDAKIVEQNAKDRPEMIYINICGNKPRYNQNLVYTSFKNVNEYPAWHKPNLGR